MDDLLTRIKRILGIDEYSVEKDDILNELISNLTNAVKVYCNIPTETVIPLQLEFIIIEGTISRYNRLGSEGLQSENIDVIGLTYIQDILEPYKAYMDSYKGFTNTKPKVRFL